MTLSVLEEHREMLSLFLENPGLPTHQSTEKGDSLEKLQIGMLFLKAMLVHKCDNLLSITQSDHVELSKWLL